MHHEPYTTHQGNYAPNINTPEAIPSFDSSKAEFSSSSSPDSQATAPSELLLTPNSDFPRLPLGPDYLSYLCQQQRETPLDNSRFEDVFSTPYQSNFLSPEAQGDSNSAAAYWHHTDPRNFSCHHHSDFISPNVEGNMPHHMQLRTRVARPNAMFLDEMDLDPNYELEPCLPVSSVPHNMLLRSQAPQSTFKSYQGFGSKLSKQPESIDSPAVATSSVTSPSMSGYEPLAPFITDEGEGEEEEDDDDIPLPEIRTLGSYTPKELAQLPYAKLIELAFRTRGDYKMGLQDLYQWFRLHTEKTKKGGKGWMNSIRHNLSMNHAFKKTGRSDAGIDSKKSTVWRLVDWAIKYGVESTTRYRKDITSRIRDSKAKRRKGKQRSRLPSQLPSQLPSEAPSPVPSQTLSQLPSQLPSQAPSQASFQVPSQTPRQAPSQASFQVSSQAPHQAPHQAPFQAPFQVPSQAPSQNLLGVPSKAPSKASLGPKGITKSVSKGIQALIPTGLKKALSPRKKNKVVSNKNSPPAAKPNDNQKPPFDFNQDPATDTRTHPIQHTQKLSPYQIAILQAGHHGVGPNTYEHSSYYDPAVPYPPPHSTDIYGRSALVAPSYLYNQPQIQMPIEYYGATPPPLSPAQVFHQIHGSGAYGGSPPPFASPQVYSQYNSPMGYGGPPPPASPAEVYEQLHGSGTYEATIPTTTSQASTPIQSHQPMQNDREKWTPASLSPVTEEPVFIVDPSLGEGTFF
ncbi:hypothetical protein F4808DRAFT_460475 [Astrocystis sublimbata]|nr:hypothetical protein F4808DRAFT_460475 [Astrocystis sublimbata]